MKTIATIALVSCLGATPVLAAGRSPASQEPTKLTDRELEQVAAGGSLPLNLDSLLVSLGQNLGLRVDLTSPGSVDLSTGVNGNRSTIAPLLQSLTTLTNQFLPPLPAIPHL